MCRIFRKGVLVVATKQKKPMAKTIIKAAVIIGVLIIPLMYSYFYLSAFWDP